MAGYLVGKYSIYTDTMGLLKWMRITNPTQPSDLKGMTSGRNWRKPRKVPEHWSDPFSFENPRSSSLQSIPLRKLDAWKKQLQTIFSPSIDGFRMIYHARISVKNHNNKKTNPAGKGNSSSKTIIVRFYVNLRACISQPIKSGWWFHSIWKIFVKMSKSSPNWGCK